MRKQKYMVTLRGQTVNHENCERIPQQGRSFCSSFVLSFTLIAPTKFYMFKVLSLESRNIQTQNCGPIQCTVCLRNEQQSKLENKNHESQQKRYH